MRLLSAVFLALIMSWSASGQDYTVTTFAGGYSPANIPGPSASLYGPNSVAVDKTGNVFFADSGEHVVLRLDATTGVLTLVAGNGTEGFSGDNGPAFYAQLGGPRGVAVDSSGNVYVADGGSGRIRLLTPAGSPSVNGNGVVNGASSAQGQPVVPGSIASVYGTFLVNTLTTASSSPLPISLRCTSAQSKHAITSTPKYQHENQML